MSHHDSGVTLNPTDCHWIDEGISGCLYSYVTKVIIIAAPK